MWKTVNILKALKVLLMAFAVVFMLTACNSNETENTAQVPLSAEAGDSSALADEHAYCWQTEVIDVLYNLMGKVAFDTYKKMTDGALALMMVAFAIWLSVRLLKQLSSFKEETLGEVWTEIAKMFFLCLVCGLIASEVNLLAMVLGDIIFPIYNAFLEFASTLLASIIPSNASKTIDVFGNPVQIAASQAICKAGKIAAISADSTAFPDSPKVMMNCMVCALSNSLSFGMTLAFDTLRGTSFTGWVVGLFVLLCFLFVKVGFVFYLIDTIFRFTVMVVMLPLMIMGYPFKKTRGLLSQGVANMLNSAAFMTFFAVIISICIMALAEVLESFKDVFASKAGAFTDFSVPFVCIMMIGFLVISSVKISGQLCDTLVGGNSNSEFQKDAKALIVGAIKFVGSMGMRIASIFIPGSIRNDVMNKMESVMNLKNKISGRADKMTGK